MANILKIDTSLRSGISGTHPHGSLSRRLTALFIQQWRENDSSIEVKYRDLGQNPIPYIDEEWVISEFGYAESEEKAQQRLKLSDELIEEIQWADVIVLGVPMYNFGPPAHLKAYIDHLVRMNKTYSFDPTKTQPYSGLLDDQKTLIILSARGSHDFDSADAPFANHVEPSIKTAFNFIGIRKIHEIAIEHQETGGSLLENSILAAEEKTRTLVRNLQTQTPP